MNIINIGDNVTGLDFNDNEITGIVENIIRFCNVALIKTGDDRSDYAEAYMDKLEIIK